MVGHATKQQYPKLVKSGLTPTLPANEGALSQNSLRDHAAAFAGRDR
jgi:hypothetical protein